jgi:uncharacterized protein (TIGR02001 family)
MAAACLALPASAQVAVEATLQNDYRVRGYSISDRDPAASVALSYDDASGIYIGGSVIGALLDGEPELVGFTANAGYAVRLDPELSLDAGVAKTQYFFGYGTSQNYDYTEIYLGLDLPVVSARVSYSPDYYRNDTHALYGEVNSGIEPAPNWLISGHAGVLTYLETPPVYVPRQTWDWRIGATRQFGPYGVHLGVSGRIQARARYSYPSGVGTGRDPAAIEFSLTRAF